MEKKKKKVLPLPRLSNTQIWYLLLFLKNSICLLHVLNEVTNPN